MSYIPKPIPASAISLRIAILTAARQSLVRVLARVTTGRTLTLADSRLMVFISAGGSVGRHKSGFAMHNITVSIYDIDASVRRGDDVRSGGGGGISSPPLVVVLLVKSLPLEIPLARLPRA
jgi:hypothetical protein